MEQGQLNWIANAKTWTRVVLLSLALRIGADAPFFSAVNGLLLQTGETPPSPSAWPSSTALARTA